MKNLDDMQLKRYKIPVPQQTAEGFNAFLPKTKVYSFEFPLVEVEKGDPILRTIVSVHDFKGRQEVKLTASVYTKDNSVMRAMKESEVYVVKDFLFMPDECLVWRYDPQLERLRALGFRTFTNQNFDMNNFVLHMNQYNGELPPLKEAYAKKMQKNKGYFYSRGTIGEWKFIHVQTKDLFPWMMLQKISDREFGTDPVYVFFNKETKEHPAEYIIWHNPNIQVMF